MQTRRPRPHDRRIRPFVPRLNPLKHPHNPQNHIATFRVDEDVGRADARPAAEGHKLPQRARGLPALRDELFGVRAPVRRVSVHQVPVAVDDVALLDEDGERVVGPAADGEGRVGQRDTDRLQRDWVDAVGCEMELVG
jgi:hypothetical protein